MDSDKKRRIRRISIPLFWIAEIVLLISLVLGLFAMYFEEDLPEAIIGADATQQLVMADGVLYNTQLSVSMHKDEGLIRFLPPQNKTDLSQWAAQVKEHMDVECAVFLYDGETIRWPLLPSQFEYRVPLVDSLIRHPVVNDTTGKIKRLGNFEYLAVFGGRSDLPRAIVVGPNDSVLRWGVIYNFRDCYWSSFERKLSTFSDTVFDPNLNELSAVFDLKKSADRPDSVANKSKFGLKIFSQSDSLLFETPGIDTSFHKFQQRHEEFPSYSIVYLPLRNEEFLQMVKTRFHDEIKTSWRTVVFPVILMIVFALFYHWIDKLTRPE